MNQKKVYRPKLEEARIENTEAEERQESSNTHVFEVPLRNGEENMADARAEEIMAESISELTKPFNQDLTDALV